MEGVIVSERPPRTKSASLWVTGSCGKATASKARQGPQRRLASLQSPSGGRNNVRAKLPWTRGLVSAPAPHFARSGGSAGWRLAHQRDRHQLGAQTVARDTAAAWEALRKREEIN